MHIIPHFSNKRWAGGIGYLCEMASCTCHLDIKSCALGVSIAERVPRRNIFLVTILPKSKSLVADLQQNTKTLLPLGPFQMGTFSQISEKKSVIDSPFGG